jgi:predicted phosphodiesterase
MSIRRSLTAGLFALLIAGSSAGCATSVPASSHPVTTTTPMTTINPNLARFGVIGDSGTGDANQLLVANALTQDGPYDAILHTGDVVYPEGDPSQLSAKVDGPYQQLLQTTRWIVTPGNHDEQTGHDTEILAHFNDPAVPYRVQIGHVAIYVLDSFRNLTSEAAWITKTAATDKAFYKIAVAHAPAQSCSRHSSDPGTDLALEPALEAAHFTLFLSGHDHNYQRFAPTRGVTHVVSGGGGAGLYPLIDCPSNLHRVSGHVNFHYLVIQADESYLTVTAKTPDGTVLDTFRIPSNLK